MSGIVQIEPGTNIGPGTRKFGFNPAATAPEDVIYWGGNMTWLTEEALGADIDIASDDPADNGVTPGDGAHAIFINGITGTHRIQNEVVILNGTADVHPVGNYLFINYSEALGVGIPNTTNLGNITIDINGANIMAVIPALYGRTVQAAYTVPAETEEGFPIKSGWLLQYDTNVANKATAQFAIMQLRIRPFNQSYTVREIFQVSSNTPYIYPYAKALPIPIKSDVYLRVIDASAGNLPVAGGFEIYLEL